MIVYLNDQFIPESEAKISCQDRGFLMGDGVYATLKVENGHTLFLQTHISRLSAQCRLIGITPPTIDPSLIETLIEKNSAFNGVYKLKIVITGGQNPDMNLPHGRNGALFIFLKPFQIAPYKPLKMALYPHSIVSAHASFKSLAHLNRYFVAQHALEHGFDDGVTTTPEGILLEASFANLFWIHTNAFFTPAKELPLHFGVTIGEIAAMMEELHFVKMRLEDIPEGAFVYRANTMSSIRPVQSIDTRVFPRNLALEEMVHTRYARRCEGAHPFALS
jgi:4-amino-4-deoxychorismate lyase